MINKKGLIYYLILIGLLFSHLYSQKLDKLKVIDSKVSFRGIFTFDQEEVWICGNRGSIYHTSDGGQSFQKKSIPDSQNADFRDIHCLSKDSILLMSVGTGSDSRIYKSINGGNSWIVTFENPHPGGFLNSIAFWDESHGIAVGDPVKGRLYIILTSDGGETWEEIDLNHIPGAYLKEAGFAASGTCVTVSGNKFAWIGTGGSKSRVYYSMNRGRSWQVYESPILSGKNSTGIFSIFFRSKEEGVVIGGDYTNENQSIRTIALTKNSGFEWKILKNGTLPFQSSIAEIILKDLPYYISTGPAGTFISKSGEDWEKISQKGYHCLSVSKDKKVVWLAGSLGRVTRFRTN